MQSLDSEVVVAIQNGTTRVLLIDRHCIQGFHIPPLAGGGNGGESPLIRAKLSKMTTYSPVAPPNPGT